MPTPAPRHLARPRRPWRLLLFVFGLTTAVLAALVASATLLPQPEPAAPGPRRRAADGANQASPDVHVDHHCSPGADHHATPFHHSNPGRRAVSRPTTTTGPATAHAPATVGGTTTTTAPSVVGATTQPTVTAPSTTVGPTTTAPTTAASTTTLVTTTSIAPPPGRRPPGRPRPAPHRPRLGWQRPRPDQRSCPAANQQASRPRPSVRSCPSWLCCTCCAGWFLSRRDTRQAAPRQPPSPPRLIRRQAGNQPWGRFP